MGFISRHRVWFYGIAGIVVVYFLYKFGMSATQAPTAADVASQGTLSPGSTVYADTSGSVGYGVPGQDVSAYAYSDPNSALNYALVSGLLNSGASSTAPSNQGAVNTVTNAAANGSILATPAAIGTYSGGGANPSAAAATSITMPDLSAQLPSAIPNAGGTLNAPSAPVITAGPGQALGGLLNGNAFTVQG